MEFVLTSVNFRKIFALQRKTQFSQLGFGEAAWMLREQVQFGSRGGYVEDMAHASILSVIAYRSVAASRLTDIEVQSLLRSAQSRNKAEGLTGVLIYDRGEFFQWLEGPPHALGRVWNSILHDPRHRQITVLRDELIDERVFDGWDLRIAIGARASVEAAVAALESPRELLKQAIEKPRSILDRSLENLFATIVIPRLREVHGREVSSDAMRRATPTIWHAELDSGVKLANILLGPQFHDTCRYIDGLLEQGANFNALYQEVFEPAQLHLGRMWDEDRCDDFHLTIGLARMQMELMRVNAAVPAEHPFNRGMSVLLSSQPQETHRLGVLMSSEVFSRRGWDVQCQAPPDDQTLGDLVHTQWFDVLKVSQSSSLRRDGRLAAMRNTIDAARAASLNQALIVLVDGRTFVERPQVHRAIHADAMSPTILEAVSLAERLSARSRNVMPVAKVSAS